MADRGEQVVVVGAGIVGACVFHELVRRGHDVTLVDRGRAGGGTTAVSGGIVRCFHDDPVLADRAVSGWRFFRRLAGSTPAVLRAECGFLHLPRRDRAAWSRRQALRLAGWTSVEWLAPGALRERFGHLLIGAGAGAVHETRALRLDAAVTVQALVDAGRGGGGRVRESLEVQALLRRDGAVVGVTTTAGPLAARSVILATGAHTPELLDRWQLDHDLVCGLVQVDRRRASTPLAGHPAFADEATGLHGRPDSDPRCVLVGLPTGRRCASGVDATPDPRHSDRIAEVGAQRLAWMAASSHAGGVRAAESRSSGGGPRVGPADGAPGLLLAAGFDGSGLRMAPWAARRIVSLVEGGCRRPALRAVTR